MPTEGAEYIAGLDPTRPLDTEVIGESNDHLQMLKLTLRNTLANQPTDAWDIPLTVGPRLVNGWEARITALDNDKALRSHFADNGNSAQITHVGAGVVAETTDGDTLRVNGEVLLVSTADRGVRHQRGTTDFRVYIDNAGDFHIRDVANTRNRISVTPVGGVVINHYQAGTPGTTRRIQTQNSGVTIDGQIDASIPGTEQNQIRVRNGVGGFQMEVNQVDGSMRLVQTSAAGGEQGAIMVATRNNNITWFANNLSVVTFRASDRALVAQTQVSISDAAPTANDHATRRDYVDGLIAGLQSQIDTLTTSLNNLIAGTTPFTGVVSAPDFNATG